MLAVLKEYASFPDRRNSRLPGTISFGGLIGVLKHTCDTPRAFVLRKNYMVIIGFTE